jgi:hypothetical protein
MIEHKIEQTNLYVPEDYNDYWEKIVAEIVQQIYVSAPAFKSAYISNSKKVFKKINSRMKVSPIDLKETLHAFYSRMIPISTPDDGPRRGVA